MNNLIRLIAVLIYPVILAFCFYLLWRKDIYKNTIKKNIKYILINTLVVGVILTIGIFVFYHFEDTIYSYDYGGYWVKSLQLREVFFNEPLQLFHVVDHSLLTDEYYLLPALFSLPFIILNVSYPFYCWGNMIAFFLPTFIVLQVLYFYHLREKWYIPSILAIIFYPAYLIIFFGEVDLGGLLFLTMMYTLTMFTPLEKIDVIDNLSINLFTFCLIFFKRWYLFNIVIFYLLYILRYFYFYKENCLKKENLKRLFIMSLSGWLVLLVLLIHYQPYLTRLLSNEFSDAYAYNDKGGKFASFTSFYSSLYLSVCLVGIYSLFKQKKIETLLILLCSIVVPMALFWSIQSFEYHHYCIVNLFMIILFVYGFLYIYWFKKNYVTYALITLGVLQLFSIFTPYIYLPILTNIKRTPEVLSYKQDIVDFSYELRRLGGESQYFYMASGDVLFNEDVVRNAILPDIHPANIYSSVLDIRDGFPRKLDEISYVIITDPIRFAYPSHQHMYEVITNAILNEPEVNNIYELVYETTILDSRVSIYKRTGEFTPAVKKIFYDGMISYYPDREDFFSYILE